ncbi:Ribosomal-protein-S5p-alanine acetyltransferase [Minicystis rosea]|nr:Ribosomal-protein-S5p-alanine acetyltransferase [Minicystis rosea]
MDAPRLETDRLLLTMPPPETAARFVAYARENDAHLARWEPPRPEGYFTEGYWYRRLERNQDELARDQSLRFALLERGKPEGPVLGHVNFNNIVRGSFQTCTLGYSIDHRWEGRGLVTEALNAAIPFVFQELKLHRVQANYIPTNERSGRVLKRLGFVVEGYAREYLFIGGAWRDHILTSLLNPRSLVPA